MIATVVAWFPAGTGELQRGAGPRAIEASAPRPADVPEEIPEERQGDDDPTAGAPAAPDDPAEIDAGLLLRAGRPVPVGLSAARTAERERNRRQAQEALLEACQGEPDSPWIGGIGAILAGASTDDELWSAAARSTGDLRLYRFADLVASGLGDPARPARDVAAREALYALFGEWILESDDYARVAEIAVRAAGDPEVAAWLARYCEREERMTALLCEMLVLDPARAQAHLDHVHPRVRAVAAGAIPDAVAAGSLEPGAGAEELARVLEASPEPELFHRALRALMELDGAHPGIADRERLETILDLAVESRVRGVELSVARTLAELSWDEPEGAGSRGPGWAVTCLAEFLQRQSTREERADADVVVETLGALRSVLSAAEESESVPVASANALRPAVESMLQQRALGDDVRGAAADALVRLGEAGVAAQMLRVAANVEESVSLRFNVLGAAGRLVPAFGEASSERAAFVDALVELVEDPELDLRRRALGILVEHELGGELDAGDLELLVNRLASESAPSVRSQVAQLLSACGTPELLPNLLPLDVVATMATGEPHELAELARLLERLAAGRADATLACSRRLAGIEHRASRIRRVRTALEMTLAVDPAEAAGLPPEDHSLVVHLALELRGAGVRITTLGGAEATGALVERLVATHVPAAVGTDGLGPGRAAHARALFLGDSLNGTPDDAREQAVLAAFADALAAEDEDPAQSARVRRDRARFLDARGRPADALADLRALLQLDAQGNLAPSPLLDPSDLRAAARLLAASADPETTAAMGCEAFGVLLHLVEREAWKGEPAALRLRDLEDLFARASECGQPDRLARVAALFGGLPPAPPEGVEEPPIEPPDGAAWEGLELAPAVLADLRALHVRVTAASGPAPEPESADPAPPEREGDGAPDETGGESDGGGGEPPTSLGHIRPA